MVCKGYKATCKICNPTFSVDLSQSNSGAFGEMNNFTDHWRSKQHMVNYRRHLDHFNNMVDGSELADTGGLLFLAHVVRFSA
eukprot:720766-Karenia_brevis.AAC.1